MVQQLNIWLKMAQQIKNIQKPNLRLLRYEDFVSFLLTFSLLNPARAADEIEKNLNKNKTFQLLL